MRNSARIITNKTNCMQMAWQVVGTGRHYQPGVTWKLANKKRANWKRAVSRIHIVGC